MWLSKSLLLAGGFLLPAIGGAVCFYLSIICIVRYYALLNSLVAYIRTFVLLHIFNGGISLFFGNYVHLCNEIGKSVTGVTRELGFSNGTMSQWKNGSFPTGDRLLKIADYFGVTVDYLLRGDEAKAKYTANNNVGSVIAQGTNAKAINSKDGTGDVSTELSELCNIYNSLDVRKRVELLNFAFSLE